MAQVYIHLTQRTPADRRAASVNRARGGVQPPGLGSLIAPPAQRPARRTHEHGLLISRFLRGPMRTQQRLPGADFDPDFPPGGTHEPPRRDAQRPPRLRPRPGHQRPARGNGPQRPAAGPLHPRATRYRRPCAPARHSLSARIATSRAAAGPLRTTNRKEHTHEGTVSIQPR